MKNDLALNRARPFATFITIILPINFLILFSLFALSGGKAPVTIYQADHGQYGGSMVKALDQAITFRIHPVNTEAEGQTYISTNKSVAAIYIPNGFSKDVSSGTSSVIHVMIDNNKLSPSYRRGLPLAILNFYKNSLPKSIPIQWHEKDFYPFNVSFMGYLSVHMTVFCL